MKWKLTAFIITALSLSPQFLLHIGLIRFTSFLEQWFTYFHASPNLIIAKQCIKHVLRQADAAPVSLGSNKTAPLTQTRQSLTPCALQKTSKEAFRDRMRPDASCPPALEDLNISEITLNNCCYVLMGLDFFPAFK